MHTAKLEPHLIIRRLFILGVSLGILGTRLVLIKNYGSEIPFLDQWGGEAFGLYRPWIKGQLTWYDLFAPHNEHRILFTRLINLALLVWNEQWNPRLQMAVNALIPVTFSALLVWSGMLYLSKLYGWVFGVAVLLFFSSNVSYGNTLWGFQSQFYLSILFSVLHIGLTFLSEPLRWPWLLGHFVGVANLLTNASGILSSISVATVAIWLFLANKDRRKTNLGVIGWNLLVSATGFLISSHIPSDDPYRPHSVEQMARAIANMYSWPFSASANSQMWTLLFAPAVVWLIYYARSKSVNRIDHCIAALIGVVVAQDLAFALYRGVAWSRYLDNLALGVLINLVCLLRWNSSGWFCALKFVIVLGWTASVCDALFDQQADFEKRAFPPIAGQTRTDLIAIRRLIRGDPIDRNARVAGLGAAGVEEVVKDPTIRAILPPSLREPLQLRFTETDTFCSYYAQATEQSPLPGFDAFKLAAASTAAEFTSEPITSSSYFLRFLVRGAFQHPCTYLIFKTNTGKIVYPEVSQDIKADEWRELHFRTPSEPFSVVAHNNSSGTIEFSAPIEIPWLTHVCEILLGSSTVIQRAGLSLLGLSTSLCILLGMHGFYKTCSKRGEAGTACLSDG